MEKERRNGEGKEERRKGEGMEKEVQATALCLVCHKLVKIWDIGCLHC